jgi:peptide/nickel transport system permease protein
MDPNAQAPASLGQEGRRLARRGTWRMVRYALVRLVTIGLTILLGVFLTILVLNRNGAMDAIVQGDVDFGIYYNQMSGVWADLTPEQIEQQRWDMEKQLGLHLPYLPRMLRWLWNAMTFQWGEALSKNSDNVVLYTGLSTYDNLQARRFEVSQIIVNHFPNTLLLVATADFIVFVAGIPLALHLGRRPGRRLNRLIGWLSPLASIPSWVHGLLLVLVFSSWLRLLPFGKMYDLLPPDSTWESVLTVARHMILPVTAILLNLFLQCVLAWKAFFALYSQEDYVELGIAKGLPARSLERRYILRPTLPYVLTSFALTLLGFWQMTTALEYFFSWPGLGLVYVLALQSYDIIIALGIVVVFAYLLGLLVFLLDIGYALLDPRIRLGNEGGTVQETSAGKVARQWRLRRVPRPDLPARGLAARRSRLSLQVVLAETWCSFRRGLGAFGRLLGDLLRQPSAVFGLLIVLGLLAMSAAALRMISNTQTEVTAPEQTPDLITLYSIPKNALPAWVNRFLIHKLPSSQLYDTRLGTAGKTVAGDRITLTFDFDYPYGGFPQDVLLEFTSTYSQTPPFVQLTWTRPDGSQVVFKPGQLPGNGNYDFSLSIPRSTLSAHGLYPLLRSVTGAIQGQGGYPVFYMLFSSPETTRPVNLRGHYTLLVEAQTFDPHTDLDSRLLLAGWVYGAAGTDNYRRDLSLPLLMGAPSALGIGLVGALLTTLLSMVIAAISAWFGGWVDLLIQRVSEANIILPILAIGVLLYHFFNISLWAILLIVILLNAFGSPIKVYRAAFLQLREAPYIEAAQAYGASGWRIIFRYMIPRLASTAIPQMAFLVPGYIFLQATLAIFGVSGTLPTWGSLIYQALREAPLQENYFWIAEPIGLLVLTGLGFALLGAALEQALDREKALLKPATRA